MEKKCGLTVSLTKAILIYVLRSENNKPLCSSCRTIRIVPVFLVALFRTSDSNAITPGELSTLPCHKHGNSFQALCYSHALAVKTRWLLLKYIEVLWSYNVFIAYIATKLETFSHSDTRLWILLSLIYISAFSELHCHRQFWKYIADIVLISISGNLCIWNHWNKYFILPISRVSEG